MKELKGLEVHEVSLVPKGANKKKFLVMKSRKGNQMLKTNEEVLDLIKSVDPKVMNRVEKILKTMGKEGEDMMKTAEAHGDAEHEPEHQPLSERAQAALKAVARILAPFKDEISDGHMDAVQNEVGIKTEAPDMKENEKDPEGEVQMSAAYPEKVTDEHHAECLDMAKKAYKAHMEKLGYQKYPSPQPMEKSKMSDEDDEDGEEEESVGKSSVAKAAKSLDLSAFPEKQRGQLELIFKANQELVQKNAQLEKELKVERDSRVTKEFQEKARGFKHLGAKTEDLAEVMKSIAEISPEDYKKVESILKTADSQIGKGSLFAELGYKGGQGAGGAEARLDALVNSVVEKADGKKTREQVYEAVIKTAEGKKLYNEYKASRAGGI